MPKIQTNDSRHGQETQGPTMMKALIEFHFYLALITLMPTWYQRDCIEEERLSKHAHYRRQSEHYQAKRKLVRALWTGTGALMLIFPTPPLMVGGLLFSTCLSFAILDESK